MGENVLPRRRLENGYSEGWQEVRGQTFASLPESVPFRPGSFVEAWIEIYVVRAESFGGVGASLKLFLISTRSSRNA